MDCNGRAVLLRYVSEYAANVATGLWKPRKHRPMAAAAQRAFNALRKQTGGAVWLQHAPIAHPWASAAQGLAARGKAGENSQVLDAS